MKTTLLFIFLFPLTQAFSQTDTTWHLLASEKGTYAMEKQQIELQLAPDTHKQLKLDIHGGPVRVSRIRIRYTDGSTQTLRTNRIFNHKKREKLLRPKKPQTAIHSVSIRYIRKVNHKQRPWFRLYVKIE